MIFSKCVCVCVFASAVEDYMNEKVQFVITSQGWDESFEDVSAEI